MRYFRSSARQTFVRETRSAFSVGHRILQNSRLPSEVRDHLLTAIVIQYNSKVESYLKDVIQSWSQHAATCGLTMEQLPVSIRAVIISQSTLATEFKRHNLDNDEQKLLSRLASFFSSRDSRVFDGSAPVTYIPHQTLLKGKSFPSEENLKILLNRLGVNNPFDRLAQIARTDVFNKLKSFQDVRNSLAHVGIQPGMNAGDLIEKLRDAERIVAWIDRLLFHHWKHFTGRSGWK